MVLPVFEFVILVLSVIVWQIWRKHAPFSALPTYYFLDPNMLIAIVFRKNRYKNKTFGAMIFEKWLELWQRHESGMAVIWTYKPMLAILSPEAVKFFSSEPSIIDKPDYYKFLHFIGGYAIFPNCSGTEAKKMKKWVMPALYPTALRNMATVMNRHAQYLVQHLAQHNYIENSQKLNKYSTMKLFFETSLEVTSRTEEEEKRIKDFVRLFIKYEELIISRLYKPWLHSDLILRFSKMSKEMDQLREEMRGIIRQVLQEIKEKITSRIHASKLLEEDSELPHSLKKSIAASFMEQHLKDPSLTLDLMIDQIMFITFAGYDTAALCLTYTLWLLGLNPEIQERAYQEIMSKSSGDVDYEVARKLTYLECVIKESLRLYPVAPIFGRKTSKTLYYGKCKVPKNTDIWFNSYSLHRNPELYPDPEEFRPERFAGDTKPYTFMPFAEGARYCIGKNYGMLELKIFLCHVLRNFTVESLDRREDVALEWGFTMYTSNPLRMKYIPRQL